MESHLSRKAQRINISDFFFLAGGNILWQGQSQAALGRAVEPGQSRLVYIGRLRVPVLKSLFGCNE